MAALLFVFLKRLERKCAKIVCSRAARPALAEPGHAPGVIGCGSRLWARPQSLRRYWSRLPRSRRRHRPSETVAVPLVDVTSRHPQTAPSQNRMTLDINLLTQQRVTDNLQQLL